MTESEITESLLNKRQDFIDSLINLKKEIKCINENINTLDKTIRIYDKNIELPKIKTKIINGKENVFRSGELSRSVLEVLRDTSEPLTNEQIAEQIKQRKGLNIHVKDLVGTVGRTLRHQANKGIIQRVDSNSYARLWELF